MRHSTRRGSHTNHLVEDPDYARSDGTAGGVDIAPGGSDASRISWDFFEGQAPG